MAENDHGSEQPRRLSKGERTRRRLFEVATRRFQDEGYEAASLRKIAAEAGVTPALLYRYFDSKEAIAQELYGNLLDAWALRAAEMPAGTWIDRTVWVTQLAFELLRPYRSMLAVIAGSMVTGDPETSPLRNEAVQAIAQPVFLDVVRRANDAPRKARRAAIAEFAYLSHLGLILHWVLDQSPDQQATRELIAESQALAPFLRMGLKTPVVGGRILSVAARMSATLRGEWEQ